MNTHHKDTLSCTRQHDKFFKTQVSSRGKKRSRNWFQDWKEGTTQVLLSSAWQTSFYAFDICDAKTRSRKLLPLRLMQWTQPIRPIGSKKLDFNEFVAAMTAKMSEKDTKQQIQKAFLLFQGGSGKISLEDLKQVAKELGIILVLWWRNFSCISFCTYGYIDLCTASHAKAHNEATFFMRECNGNAIKPNLTTSGETMSDEELLEMIKEADRDGDGLVSEEEFLRIIRRGWTKSKSSL